MSEKLQPQLTLASLVIVLDIADFGTVKVLTLRSVNTVAELATATRKLII